ncbi:PREDICTED: transmembrane 9 superfamily member 2-like [Acropora digitifera]|uniref:transmembrane 9 superfamily member 2-like n=1 Tax=Acropora digitifera TaxID=70779 RepID=UPI00077A8742|nr:PREDICTED: transmembrane 9 superfamily member 2-like [Acropora digitifera]
MDHMGLERSRVCLFVILIACVSHNTAFYLPELAPVSYCEPGKQTSPGCLSKIELFVNRLDSVKSVIPYEYSRFDFCAPPSDEKTPSENLGQVIYQDLHGKHLVYCKYSHTSCEILGLKLGLGLIYETISSGS